jgi:hypothetical protein
MHYADYKTILSPKNNMNLNLAHSDNVDKIVPIVTLYCFLRYHPSSDHRR